jgi:hypothetical protein
MIVILGLVPFTAATQGSALSVLAPGTAVAQFTQSHGSPARPCHRAALSGQLGACLTGFSFSAIIENASADTLPPPANSAGWRLHNSALPRQYAGFGLFKPPRSSV